MELGKQGILRTFKSGACALILAVGCLMTGHETAHAQQSDAYVVGNDRGGLLLDRIANIRQLRATGRAVQIQGNICYSTCTMYLGLPQTCISPQTTFGFHGPSSYGRPLEPELFNRASAVIGRHYPAPLREWYMREGRHEIRMLYRFTGSEIIEMGVRQC